MDGTAFVGGAVGKCLCVHECECGTMCSLPFCTQVWGYVCMNMIILLAVHRFVHECVYICIGMSLEVLECDTHVHVFVHECVCMYT